VLKFAVVGQRKAVYKAKQLNIKLRFVSYSAYLCIGVATNLSRRRRRRGQQGGHVPPKIPEKNKFFGQLLRKIRAFFGQKSCKIREFCKFLGQIS